MHRTSFKNHLSILQKTTARQCFINLSVLTLFLFALFLAVGVTRTATISIPTTTTDFAAIDAYVEIQIHEQRIPGLALGIVHGDQIVHLKGFGVAAPNREPMTGQTPLSIGSLTKSFTAVAIMQLVEAGELDLDAPVQRYLPWFRVADQEISTRITLRRLLNHSSGLPRDFEPNQDSKELEERLRNLSTTQLEQAIDTYGYSNVGYQVLAAIIQEVTGQSYEDYVRKHIFVPLEMHQSFATVSEAAQEHRVTGYNYWFGLPVASELPPYQTGPGNGGLFSSAEDMSHYLITHLNQGHFETVTLLSPAGIAEVHRPVTPRPDGAYAMGWGVQTVDGVTFLSHSGQTYNYMAKMILMPNSEWGVVILQNSQYTVKLMTGNHTQDTIADGVANILINHQPPSQTHPSETFLAAYGVLALIIGIQFMGIIRSWAMLRRWQLPEYRPHGKRKLLWHIVVPLTLDLGWAMLILIGLPMTNNLTKLAYQIPDFTYTLLASGATALGWGITRTIWAYSILHRPGAANSNGMPNMES